MNQKMPKNWDEVPVLAMGEVSDEIVEGPCRDYRAIIVKRAFAATYEESDNPQQCITDMLADLRHASDLLGLDFAKLDKTAYNHYLVERSSSEPIHRLGISASLDLVEIVPETWTNWFFGLISEQSNFGWGTNDRTLVRASRLIEEWKPKLEDVRGEDILDEEIDAFIATMEALGDTYINLEC